MTAKEALRRVHELDKAVDAALAQIVSYEADAERMTRIYGAAGGAEGGKQAYDGAIVRLAAARQRCSLINEEYVAYKTMIVDRINLLTNSTYRKVLTYVYINKAKDGAPLGWKQIAVLMGKSARLTQQLHGAALRAFEKVAPTENDFAKLR